MAKSLKSPDPLDIPQPTGGPLTFHGIPIATYAGNPMPYLVGSPALMDVYQKLLDQAEKDYLVWRSKGHPPLQISWDLETPTSPTSPPTTPEGCPAGHTPLDSYDMETPTTPPLSSDTPQAARPQRISLPLDRHTGALLPLTESEAQQAMLLVSEGASDTPPQELFEEDEEKTW